MIFDPFKYPGVGDDDARFSGTLRPEQRRVIRRPGVRSEPPLPRFAREVGTSRALDTFELVWINLTSAEADDIVRQWSAASNGVRPITYKPDDRTGPVTVLMLGSPETERVSAGLRRVTVRLEQQA